MRSAIFGGLALLALSGAAAGQADYVFVDFTGASIPSSGTTAPDVVRTSTATIFPAPGYRYAFNPVVTGSGLLGFILVPSPTQLASVINTFSVGQQRFLFGAVRNPPGTIPTDLDNETLAGTFSGLTLSFTFEQEILADGRCRAAIRNITKPSGFGFNVNSGGGHVQTWTPPPPVRSEFHFQGNLLSVKQLGLAPASGPGKMRFLDDAAFGPILGGIGAEDTYPNPPTAHGVTAAQSQFGTTAEFGLPPVGGEIDTVYRTSPTRDTADPGNSAKRRGIGLAFWSANRDNWPEDRNGQWTMVWDLLIPQSVWDAGGTVALIEDNHNNAASADAFIRIVGGQARIGYWVSEANYLAAPQIQPNQWFRLVIACDHYRAFNSRVFVNGQLLGVTGSGWLYASCRESAPRWGDLPAANLAMPLDLPEGSAVAPATWNDWGQFPSPWAKSPNSAAAPMAATTCLFADLQGRGESVYVANFAYTDEAMDDAAIAALGGPNGRGVFYLRPASCAADFDGNGQREVADIFAFLSAWFDGDPAAYEFGGTPGVPAIFAFLSAWFAGCP